MCGASSSEEVAGSVDTHVDTTAAKRSHELPPPSEQRRTVSSSVDLLSLCVAGSTLTLFSQSICRDSQARMVAPLH